MTINLQIYSCFSTSHSDFIKHYHGLFFLTWQHPITTDKLDSLYNHITLLLRPIKSNIPVTSQGKNKSGRNGKRKLGKSM